MTTSHPGPFSVLVRDLVGRPGEMRERELDVAAPERWGEGLVAVPAGESVHLDLRLESVHEGILVSGTAGSRYAGECGRCLREISADVEVEFQELFAYSGSEATDFEVRDDRVDVGELVRDGIVLSLPFQPVCRPDCPGLDPITGERLVDVPDAAPRAEIDPRWAALARFSSESAEDADESASEDQPSSRSQTP